MSRKILIVTGDGGDGYEALYAYQRFEEARWIPVVAAPARRRLHMVFHDLEAGWDTYVERAGPSIDADVVITAVAAREFAAVLMVGGRAPEYLRNDASLISLVHEFTAQNKGVFALGHGVQILAAAGALKGRSLTAHPNVRVEVERSGGTYVHKPAVRDGNLVTGQTWRAHADFYREVFECLE
jgi:protease I